MPPTISPAGAKLLAVDLAALGEEGDAIRISVVGGGNAGLQYGVDFEPEAGADDIVIELPGGGRVVIDSWSARLMDDVVIDARPSEGDPEGGMGLWIRKRREDEGGEGCRRSS